MNRHIKRIRRRFFMEHLEERRVLATIAEISNTFNTGTALVRSQAQSAASAGFSQDIPGLVRGLAESTNIGSKLREAFSITLSPIETPSQLKTLLSNEGFTVEYLGTDLSTDQRGDVLRVSKTLTWASAAMVNSLQLSEIPYFQGIRNHGIGGAFSGSSGPISFTVTLGVAKRGERLSFFVGEGSVLNVSNATGVAHITGGFGKGKLLNLQTSGKLSAQVTGQLRIADRDSVPGDGRFEVTATNLSSAVAGNIRGSVNLSLSAKTDIPFLKDLKAVGTWRRELGISVTSEAPLLWSFDAGTTAQSLRTKLINGFFDAKNGLQLPPQLQNVLNIKLDTIHKSVDDLIDVDGTLGWTFDEIARDDISTVLKSSGFEIATFNNALLNNLLNGKAVNILKYRTQGTLGPWSQSQEYPWGATAIGPFTLEATAKIAGALSGKYIVDLGLDTTGAWIGRDTSISFGGQITAGAGASVKLLGLAGYKAELNVGASVNVSMSISDPEPQDGRLYFDELFDPAKDRLLDLPKLVLASMRVSTRLDTFVEGTVIRELPWPFKDKTLADERRPLAMIANSDQGPKLSASKRKYPLTVSALAMPASYDPLTGQLTLKKTNAASIVTLSQNAGKVTVRWSGYSDKAFAGVKKVLFYGSDLNDSLSVNGSFLPTITAYGAGGNDSLFGGDAKDSLFGGLGDDVLSGGKGNDVLSGGSGNDLAQGGEGNDLLEDGLGSNTMLGEEGDDQIRGGKNSDFIDGGEGNDVLYGDYGITQGTADVIYGGYGDDVLYGNYGNDQLFGGSGRDNLSGGSGNDDLLGGAGDDLIHGNDGADHIKGGSNNDMLFGDVGNDRVDGDDGNDIVNGGLDSDSLAGGEGNDTIVGGQGADTLRGGAGDDILQGEDGDDTLNGEKGSDRVYGGAGNDVIQIDFFSNDGDVADALSGGVDQDSIFAIGSGLNDELSITQLGPNRFRAVGVLQQSDRTALQGLVNFTAFEDIERVGLAGLEGDDRLIADSTVTRSLDLHGGNGNDTLKGGSRADRLFGGDGNDNLYGGAGDDVLQAENGNDLLYGESGADRLYGGDGSDVLNGGAGRDVQYGGAGNDELNAGPGNLGDLMYGEADDDTIYGGAGVDVIGGGVGHDRLSGGDLFDFITGGYGNDVIEGGNGRDILLGEQGNDQIWSGTPSGATDRINSNWEAEVDRLAARAEEIRTVLRPELNRQLADPTITPEQRVLITRELESLWSEYKVLLLSQIELIPIGDVTPDTVDGGAGDDKLYGGDFNDMLNGGEGDDDINVSGGRDVIVGGNGENDKYVVFGSANADTVLLKQRQDQEGNYIVEYFVNGTLTATLEELDIEVAAVYGLEGDDRLQVDFAETAVKKVFFDGGEGDDVLNATGCPVAVELQGGGGSDTLYGGLSGDTLYGGEGADTIYGSEGNDNLFGENGDDALYGEDGDDFLNAGAGVNETLIGGSGWDRYKETDIALKYPFLNPVNSQLMNAEPWDVKQLESAATVQTLNALAAIARQAPGKLFGSIFQFDSLGRRLTDENGNQAYDIQLYKDDGSKDVKVRVKFGGEWNDNDPAPANLGNGQMRFWHILLHRARLQKYLGGDKAYLSREISFEELNSLDAGSKFHNSVQALKEYLPYQVAAVSPTSWSGAKLKSEFDKGNPMALMLWVRNISSHPANGAVVNVELRNGTYYVKVLNVSSTGEYGVHEMTWESIQASNSVRYLVWSNLAVKRT